MMRQLIATVLTTSAIAITIPFFAQTTQARSEVKFICSDGFDRASGQRLPTTYAWTDKGKIAIVRWSKKWGSGQAFTPQRRCEEVSPRFQEAFNNGTLNFITNGTMNGQPTICAAKENKGACQTLLMTLRPEENPLQLLNNLKDVLNGRGAGPIQHSSGTPQVYYQVDMEAFLNNAPVEEE
jgi:Circadian oscillating protein COP23